MVLPRRDSCALGVTYRLGNRPTFGQATSDKVAEPTIYGDGHKPHHAVCNFWMQPVGPCTHCDRYYRLTAAGWVFGNAEDFLELTEEERRMVDSRFPQSFKKAEGSCES